MLVAGVASVLFLRLCVPLVFASSFSCTQGRVETPLEMHEEIEVTSPERGAYVNGDRITVRGHVVDPTLLTRLLVEDSQVNVDDHGDFAIDLTVAPGLQLLHTVAVLDDGSEVRDTRAIMAGTLADAQTPATRGLRATLAPETIQTLGQAAANELANAELGKILEAYGPTSKTGSGCFQATVSMTQLDIGDATMSAIPRAGGLDIELQLEDITASVNADYEAACLGGSSVVGFTADRFTVTASVSLSAVEGELRSSVEVHSSDIDDFAITYTGVSFLDSALTNVDWLMGPALGWVIEDQMGPAFEVVLSDFASRDRSITVAGTELALRTRADSLIFQDSGALLEVATATFVVGAEGPGYPITPVDTPIAAQPNSISGFDLRVTDEVFNQALTALWSSGLLTQTMTPKDLGSVDFGGQLEEVSVEALLAPMIRFGEQGELPTMVLGDFIIELRGKGRTHAKIAVAAELDLTAAERTDLAPGSTILEPGSSARTLWIDVLDIDPRSQELLDEDLVKAIAGSAMKRLGRQLGQQVGFITLPSFGGTTLLAPQVATRPGYLQLQGELGVAE